MTSEYLSTIISQLLKEKKKLIEKEKQEIPMVKKICFSPQFLSSLSDSELDFVMMHEVMYVALKHCARGRDYEPERFNIACDIVVNSNILLSNNMDEKSISISKYGVSMHVAPDGKEGYEYTAEQVYKMLPYDT